MQDNARRTGLGTWAAFLAAPFAILAAIGMFATYTVGLPHARWAVREAALDRVAALPAASPVPAAQRAQLEGQLGEAAGVLDAADRPAVIAAARAEARSHFLRESESVQARMMLLLSVGGLACFAFGVMVLGLARQ